MSKPKKDDDPYDPVEGQRRFEAALRGARMTGHKPLSDIVKKRQDKKAKPKRRPAK